MTKPDPIRAYLAAIGAKGGRASSDALTPTQRKRRAKKLSALAHASMTPEQRRARAMKGVAGRMAKRKANSALPK